MTTVRVQTIDTKHGIGMVSVAGWIADEDVERLRRTLLAAAEGHRHLIVDLSGALDLSAALVGALAEVAAMVRWSGGQFVVVASGDVAARIAQAGLSEGLRVLPDMAQARKALLGAE